MIQTSVAILLLFNLILALPSHAADYYVDSARGNDAWDGRSPQSEPGNAGPWRTLARLAATPLSVGDSVRLHCAGSWRETLRIDGFGSAAAPLELGAYGDCEDGSKPQVIASRLTGGWIRGDGDVYSVGADEEVKQVFVDGVLLEAARYPALGLFTAQAGVGDHQKGGVRDTDLRPLVGRDVAGATLHIRTVGWSIETLSVACLTDNRLEFTTRSRFPVRKGAGYFLAGKAWMLSPGRWHWDRGQQRLRLWLADGSDPTRHQIEVTSLDYGLHLKGNDYVHVRDLRVSHAGLDGIRADGTQHVVLEGVEIASSGRDGIAFDEKSVGSVVQGSTVRASGRDGISVLRSQGASVLDNTVEDSGTVGFFHNSLAAINASGAHYARVERNTIRRAGYHGITFSRRAHIINNVIEDVCLVLDDCGGIYSWSGNEPVRYESEVMGNLIKTAKGGRQGNPEPYTIAAGIYLDDLTSGINVIGNTVVDAQRGIMLHNAFANRVESNLLFQNREHALVLDMGHRSFDQRHLLPNTIVKNVFTASVQKPVVFYLNRSNREHADVFDRNTYLTTSGRHVFEAQKLRGEKSERRSYDLSHLQRDLGLEQTGRSPLFDPSAAALLLNPSSLARDVPCPWDKDVVACASATDLNGALLGWPQHMAPRTSRLVLLQQAN